MCDDDAIRELKQQIADADKLWEMDGCDKATELREFLRKICPHVEKVETEDSGVHQCTCCQKLFRKERG